MDAWELDDLEAARVASGRLYHEFISVPDLSGGLYVLEAKVAVGGDVRAIRTGSVVFVAAGVEHRFHDIEERLVLLVMFGPAEYARQGT
jgi:hypothetical protein